MKNTECANSVFTSRSDAAYGRWLILLFLNNPSLIHRCPRTFLRQSRTSPSLIRNKTISQSNQIIRQLKHRMNLMCNVTPRCSRQISLNEVPNREPNTDRPSRFEHTFSMTFNTIEDFNILFSIWLLIYASLYLHGDWVHNLNECHIWTEILSCVVDGYIVDPAGWHDGAALLVWRIHIRGQERRAPHVICICFLFMLEIDYSVVVLTDWVWTVIRI